MAIREYPSTNQLAIGGVSRVDIVGHSLAAGGGAPGSNFWEGWIDKLANQLNARVRDGAKGGSMVSMPEGGTLYTGGTTSNFSGVVRTLLDYPGNNQFLGFQPFLPLSQLACVMHTTNDMAWVGTRFTSVIEALRVEICRFRAANVFEDTSTSLLTSGAGITPITYGGGAWTPTPAYGYTSNSTWTATTTPYTGAGTSKITITVPADLNAANATLQFGFLCGTTANHGALWELHDVTSGDTTLATWDLRGITNYAAGLSSAQAQAVNVVRRQTLGQGPSTTLNGAQWTSATTLTVASTTGFSTAGTLRIDDAIIMYTGKTATTFTGCTQAAGTYTNLASTGTPIWGSRSLELRPTAITGGGQAMFDYWAIEAPNPGIVVLPLMYKPLNFALWNTWPYGQVYGQVGANITAGATTMTMNTATVTGAMTTGTGANAITGGGAFPTAIGSLVKIDTEVIYATPISATSLTANVRGAIGTTAATHVAGSTIYPWVRAGDTITLNPGNAGAETLKVASVTTNTITFTSPAVNAHTSGEMFISGYQASDVDYQNLQVQALAAEFDANVIPVPTTDLISPNGTKADPLMVIGDGIHPSTEGHTQIAKRVYQYIQPRLNLDLAVHAQPLDIGPWQGDVQYGMMTLNANWTSYNGISNPSLNANGYTVRLKKDMITGRVQMEGAVKCNSAANISTVICTVPQGTRPGQDIMRIVPSQSGPTTIRIAQTGDVTIVQGGSVNYTELACTWLAEN